MKGFVGDEHLRVVRLVLRGSDVEFAIMVRSYDQTRLLSPTSSWN